MRLLFLTEFYPGDGETFTGGVEARAWHVTRALAKDHTVTVVTSRRRGEPRETVRGRLRVLRVGPSYPYSNNGYVLHRLLWAMRAFLAGRRIDADVVEGTSFLTYVPAALIGRARGIPRVATYHETWLGSWVKRKGRWTGTLGEVWERLALRLGWTRIISVSAFTKRALIAAGVAPDRIDVVPNGIDLSRFEFEAEQPGSPTIACVSRLIDSKRVDLLIRALPHVAERVPAVRVELVGTGSELESLRELATATGVGDRVSFLGRVASNDEVLRTVKRASVFALPSESEGFGIVVLEAMAAGVPVVCTDIEPLRELTGGRGALLFSPGDRDGLAEMLVSLLTDARLRDEKAREASDRARDFAWPALVAQLESVYGELASAG